jgi:branched-chain amino acid transport system ATP-binding protein
MLLEVHDLSVNYGEIQALRSISLSADQGEIVTVIGANGAGKTTALSAMSGLLKSGPASRIVYDGTDITRLPPHKRVELGIAHVPEGRHVFAAMTVAENLEMGAFLRSRRGSPEYQADLDAVLGLFPVLGTRAAQIAGTLSGGEQQMLAIGRALMGGPRLLLIDEPSLGLAPLIVKGIFEAFGEIRSRGVTFLLVEQNARQALRIADRAYVLETGEITRSGAASDLMDDDAIKRAYLGGNVAV